MVSAIGAYSLGSSTEGLEGLSELSPGEYVALPKSFSDEKIYQGQDIEFLGFRWNLMLGARAGRIYKISPQLVTQDFDGARRAHIGAEKFFSGELGRPSERNARRIFWRMPGGNVILEQESHGTVHCVQFFVTGGPFKFTLADLAEVAADGSQPKGAGAVRRQNSPWFLNAIAQVFVFSIPVVIGYWIWRPLGGAAIVLALGSWASSLVRVGIASHPAKASLLRKMSIAVVAGIWACSVGAVVIGFTLLLSIPNWAAVLLFLWGWMAVGYPGWAEVRTLSQYMNTEFADGKAGDGDAEERLANAMAKGLFSPYFDRKWWPLG